MYADRVPPALEFVGLGLMLPAERVLLKALTPLMPEQGCCRSAKTGTPVTMIALIFFGLTQ